ncbi:alpha/beta fold hydrolase [Burkholderia ubonensis]|uniref:alpha/beta fold hydrolase n=1 Tax=Burkholderia ubonensis TaxID=101571 RepID=UPI0022B755A2|nr:alpha/beta hydrolase [Burkholderia ubonensis]
MPLRKYVYRRYHDDPPTYLKKIDVPTLILHGDDDQIVPIDDSARLSAKIVKHAQLKIVEGGSHGLCVVNADRINAELLAFLQA